MQRIREWMEANPEEGKGALVRIDAPRPLTPGGGTLRWLVPPDALTAARLHR